MTVEEDRFWSDLDKSGGPDACWPWMRRRDAKGYGHAWFRKKNPRAHRVAWILANGEIPEGLCVLHKCDNPPCCNPAHLFLGTQLENIADRHAKGRSAGGHRGGDDHYAIKISAADAVVARTLVAFGAYQRDVAAYFGVSRSCIHSIVAGRRSHVLLRAVDESKVAKERAPRLPQRRAVGERNPHYRLTDEVVAQIRADRSDGLSFRAIGKRHGVSASHVRKIVHGSVRKAPGIEHCVPNGAPKHEQDDPAVWDEQVDATLEAMR